MSTPIKIKRRLSCTEIYLQLYFRYGYTENEYILQISLNEYYSSIISYIDNLNHSCTIYNQNFQQKRKNIICWRDAISFMNIVID